jgi:hypothetical protein
MNKEAYHQGYLDGVRADTGQPCGSSYISSSYQCHHDKPGGGGKSASGQNVSPEASRVANNAAAATFRKVVRQLGPGAAKKFAAIRDEQNAGFISPKAARRKMERKLGSQKAGVIAKLLEAEAQEVSSVLSAIERERKK